MLNESRDNILVERLERSLEIESVLCSLSEQRSCKVISLVLHRIINEGLVDHAKRELMLAGMFDKEVDESEAAGSWNILCAEAVVELMELFARQGHSGMSASMTQELFNRLSKVEALTELTDNPDEWNDISEMQGGKPGWQSQRNPSAFSEDNGKTYYDLNDACFKFTDEEDGCVYTGSPESRGCKRTMHSSKHVEITNAR